MTKNKSTYEKAFGSGNLFSESGFDEMQRAENRSIAFKVFRVSFWVHLLAAMSIVCVGVYKINDDLVIAGFIYHIVNLVTYTAYAAMSAAKGLLPDKFAKDYRSPWFTLVWVGCAVVWITDQDLFMSMLWTSTAVYHVIMCFIVKRNDKVLKKQLEDDGEE